MTDALTSFEQQRELRIAANKRKLEALGVIQAKERLCPSLSPDEPVNAPKRIRKPRQVQTGPLEPRRSARERPVVNYKEQPDSFHERIPGSKAERLVRFINREYIDPSLLSSPKQRSAVDSGKGVRVQGGRVYDSKFGVTCHWCRQKTVEHKVTCTNEDCGSGLRLPVSFCKMCLKNRHGEDVDVAESSGRWVCPCCRVSCGQGCTSCCNCGPCRKKASLLPTGQIIKDARSAGFDNVHDFLVHQQTGEAADLIASRKHNFAWASWMEVREVPALPQTDAAGLPEVLKTAKQTVLSDSLPVVKVQSCANGAAPLSRKADRKQKALMAIGLAPLPQAICA